MSVIAFTKSSLPFGWLGNMSAFKVNFEGQEWNSSEALFQSMRFDDPSIKARIRESSNGFTAKLVAKKFADQMVVEKCSEKDVANMRVCLLAKLGSNPELKPMLMETGDSLIIEDVTKRGASGTNLFWGMMKTENRFIGDGGWIGDNCLGELWMGIRYEFRRLESLLGSKK